MSCFILMITALIFSRSSNLVKLSALFMTDASQASSYRRIQRFLSDFSIDYTQLARFIFHLFEFKRVRLTLDRTNWKWGKKHQYSDAGDRSQRDCHSYFLDTAQ